MALSFDTQGPAGEQVFSTSPQISDILARYFGTPSTPAAANTSTAPGGGTGLGEGTIGGRPLGHPLGGDMGARGSGFGSDNGVAGEAQSFADRNTAVHPSLMGSLALAGSMLPGGLGLPLAGPLGGLALQALGISPGDVLGGIGQAFGIGGSPFNVAGPSLSPEAIAGILGSINSLPANAPRVTVMNALNDALAKARSAAQTPGAQTGGAGPGLSAGTGQVTGGGFGPTNIGGAGVSHGLAGSGVGVGTGGIAGGDNRADPGNAGGGGPAGGTSGGLSGGGPRGF